MNVTNQDLLTVAKVLGVVAFFFIVVPLLVTAFPQLVGADESYVVLSSSMEPTISAGDVVIVNEVSPETIEKGDTITFRRQTSDGIGQTTHRVVEVLETERGLQFRTKGDANDAADPEPVAAVNVVGVVAFHFPLIGYLVEFANTGVGIALLIVVPAVILGLLEIRDVLDSPGSDESTSTCTEAGSDKQ